VDAAGRQAPAVSVEEVARAIGAHVEVSDPFDLAATQEKLLTLLNRKDGVNVLVLRQICALSPQKKWKKLFEVSVNQDVCLGESCGCNRLCTRIFRCPGLVWDGQKKKARIDEVICSGCGVCASVCPSGAIQKKEAA